jgi:hypothetical protein
MRNSIRSTGTIACGFDISLDSLRPQNATSMVKVVSAESCLAALHPPHSPVPIWNARPLPVRGLLHQASLHRVLNIFQFLVALLHRVLDCASFASDANSDSPGCFRLGKSLQVTKKMRSESAGRRKRGGTSAGIKNERSEEKPQRVYKQDSALPSYLPETRRLCWRTPAKGRRVRNARTLHYPGREGRGRAVLGSVLFPPVCRLPFQGTNSAELIAIRTVNCFFVATIGNGRLERRAGLDERNTGRRTLRKPARQSAITPGNARGISSGRDDARSDS